MLNDMLYTENIPLSFSYSYLARVMYFQVLFICSVLYLLFHHRCVNPVCIKEIFQDFKLKPSEAGRKMVLQQQVLQYPIAYLLLAVFAGIYVCAIITFWNRFLIHESPVCDLDFDCFN